MTAISINNLSLSFGITPILKNISFALEDSDKLGIIGVNGSGKTSLFKLITGEYSPDDGDIYISKDKTVGILTQYGAFDNDDKDSEHDSAIDHMYRAFPALVAAEKRLSELELLMTNYTDPRHESLMREYTELHERFIQDGGLEYKGRAASILSKLGFDEKLMQTSTQLLSGGQRTRLALAIELSKEPDILMLDEPTNHLDIETLGWLENFLSQYKKCVMVISHDRYFLDRITNKTLVIENHKAKLYNGSYTRSAEQRRIDREIYEKHYRDQQKEIARQQAYIAQQRAWNRERNIIAAESRQKLLDKMDKLDAPESSPKSIKMTFGGSISSGNDVLYVRSLSMDFPGRHLFSDLDFLVKKNDRLLIVGKNGCGKSTLIKLIMGKLKPTAGKIEEGYNVVIGYYDQENQNLDDTKTVLDELWDAYPRKTETEIRSTLAMFRFIGDDVYKEVNILSGGERARLTLSKLILSKMNVLVLDEPTNHLDINSREALEDALLQFDGTIIAVSHDRYFIERLATRIIEIRPDGHALGDMLDYNVTHMGEGYTEFRRFCEERRSHMSNVGGDMTAYTSETASKEKYLRNKQVMSEARKLANRKQKLETEAKRLEEILDELTKQISDPDNATNFQLLMELDTQKNDTEEQLLAIYEEFEQINS